MLLAIAKRFEFLYSLLAAPTNSTFSKVTVFAAVEPMFIKLVLLLPVLLCLVIFALYIYAVFSLVSAAKVINLPAITFIFLEPLISFPKISIEVLSNAVNAPESI